MYLRINFQLLNEKVVRFAYNYVVKSGQPRNAFRASLCQIQKFSHKGEIYFEQKT